MDVAVTNPRTVAIRKFESYLPLAPRFTSLAEHIISEAKRLLIYNDNTVSEISFPLEFNDLSHFVKYFKRGTGHTLQVFRSL